MPHALIDRHPPSTHRYSLRVYYEDTDAGGVVYHANYLRYAERARTEALREAGIPHAELVQRFSLMFMVHRAEIGYVRPAMLDDLLVVETETLDVGGASVRLRQTIHGPGGIRAALHIKLACVRIGGNKPARIPPAWRAALAALASGAGTWVVPSDGGSGPVPSGAGRGPVSSGTGRGPVPCGAGQ